MAAGLVATAAGISYAAGLNPPLQLTSALGVNATQTPGVGQVLIVGPDGGATNTLTVNNAAGSTIFNVNTATGTVYANGLTVDGGDTFSALGVNTATPNGAPVVLAVNGGVVLEAPDGGDLDSGLHVQAPNGNDVLMTDPLHSRVGIGTSAPSALLEVNGAAKIDGVATVAGETNTSTLGVAGNVTVDAGVQSLTGTVTGLDTVGSLTVNTFGAGIVQSSSGGVLSSSSALTAPVSITYSTSASGVKGLDIEGTSGSTGTAYMYYGRLATTAVPAGGGYLINVAATGDNTGSITVDVNGNLTTGAVSAGNVTGTTLHTSNTQIDNYGHTFCSSSAATASFLSMAGSCANVGGQTGGDFVAYGSGYTTTAVAGFAQVYSGTSSSAVLAAQWNASQVMSLGGSTYTAGCDHLGTTATTGVVTCNAASDMRLKRDDGPLEDALAMIMATPVHRGAWLDDPRAMAPPDEPQIFFFAQEVARSIPEAVRAPKGPDDVWQLKDRPVLATTVRAVQEVEGQVLDCRADMEDLQVELARERQERERLRGEVALPTARVERLEGLLVMRTQTIH